MTAADLREAADLLVNSPRGHLRSDQLHALADDVEAGRVSLAPHLADRRSRLAYYIEAGRVSLEPAAATPPPSWLGHGV